MSIENIAVLGAGSYGTCLAMLFGNAGHRVSLWAPMAAVRTPTREPAATTVQMLMT